MKRPSNAFVTILLLVVWVWITFHPQLYRIEQQSMFPTLENGEVHLVLKNSLVRKVSINRQDIVVIDHTDDKRNIEVVKRVIGLPGDRIEIRHGMLFINNELLYEPYLLFRCEECDNQTFTVPRQHYFVMGDNRPYSYDSRHYGAVPKANIVGKVVW